MANILKTFIGDKKRWRQYQKDIEALPEPYAKTLKALQAYIWNFASSAGMMDALDEILRMFQESASENVPVQNIVGDDPVEFAESIMAQYPDDQWLFKYRERLRTQVKEAEL